MEYLPLTLSLVKGVSVGPLESIHVCPAIGILVDWCLTSSWEMERVLVDWCLTSSRIKGNVTALLPSFLELVDKRAMGVSHD